ncbi:MAG: GtrA family protein [Oscillospiraceae bacterium]|nr:GtrA family protein [Oscillospiraceae bacterium]
MLEALLQFVLRLMPKPIKRLWDKYEDVWRYCYYGAWTTLLSILTKLAGRELFALAGYSVDKQAIPNGLNTTISWLICATFAFVVNKKYVFHSETHEKKAVLREMLTFFGGRGATYFLELAIMELPAIFGWNYILMTILSQFVILALNYIISKLIVFRKKGGKQEPDKETAQSESAEETE